MDEKQEEFYIGIDLGDHWTQISYCRPGMQEPETISVVAGEERYRIPTTPYKKSLSMGNGQEAREMLTSFLRKVLLFVPELTDFSAIRALTFHLEELNLKNVELLKSISKQLGIPENHVFLQDSRESFCDFAMNQPYELMQHDVMLFFCERNELIAFWLTREEKTRPQKIEIQTLNLGTLPLPAEERDESFAGMAEAAMHGKIISSVYLMGDGLEGGWLKDSLHVLCRGRKAFQGKNLYTKGACCHSMLMAANKEREYVYFSEHMITQNIFIQVKSGNRTFFRELVEAGTSCYEVQASCQVLLAGEPDVDVWVQEPDSKNARIESLQLTDLPLRPPKATRLLIEALPGDKKQVIIRITDLGFGAWYATSGKIWEYGINE